LAPREGWCYQHVQAIIAAVDQYAEAALGNREFFLNKPYGIGGGRTRDDPDDSGSRNLSPRLARYSIKASICLAMLAKRIAGF
jgi:hypothetical protein